MIALAFFLFWLGGEFREPLIAQHKLLVADGAENGNFFDKAVIYVVRHDREGAYGLIVNNPGIGGPVEEEKVSSLYMRREDALPVYTEDVDSIPKDAIWSLVVKGYSGWSRKQLDREIRRKDWRVLDFDGALVADTDPQLMWDAAMQRVKNTL